jgi:anaerobic selenocysteine-containing dehydrogenase
MLPIGQESIASRATAACALRVAAPLQPWRTAGSHVWIPIPRIRPEQPFARRAAPELVNHKDRLTRPLRRTRPKGDTDPGWEEISWDAALDQIADAMRRTAAQYGPEGVAFSRSSPSTTAMADSAPFV